MWQKCIQNHLNTDILTSSVTETIKDEERLLRRVNRDNEQKSDSGQT